MTGSFRESPQGIFDTFWICVGKRVGVETVRGGLLDLDNRS